MKNAFILAIAILWMVWPGYSVMLTTVPANNCQTNVLTDRADEKNGETPSRELTGPELRAWLKATYFDGKHIELGYSSARQKMYNFIDNHDNKITCVYSGYQQSWTYGGSGTNPDPINCEHSVPQSFFSENEPMRSDIHHLYPTYSNWNSVRSNFPFSDIDDTKTTKWMYQTTSQTTIPTTNIDAYSEYTSGTFEPREDHKGNLARSVFYFFTVYPTQAGDISKVASMETLYKWHLADPVDAAEIQRNTDVAKYQGNRNFYIDQPELVAKAWGFVQETNGTDIVIFSLAEQKAPAIIDALNHTVNVTVVNGTALTSLVPTISVSTGATVSPATGVAQNFSSPVQYTVTAQDNQTKQLWTVTVTEAQPAGTVGLPFTQNFESLTKETSVEIEGWTNFMETGKRTWMVKEYTANKYAQFSSYNSYEANTGWLITPLIDLDKTQNELFTFDINIGYYTHEGLTVLISENYNGSNVSDATWTDITSNFTLPKTPTSGYGTFATAGKANLNQFKGKVAIAFKYVGDYNTQKTTTYQVDNIKIEGEAAATGTEANIVSFTVPGIIGQATIDNIAKTVKATVSANSTLNGLVPVIGVSTGASISPTSGVAQNFEAPITYTVTSEDKNTTNQWTVTVVKEVIVPGSEAKILTFKLDQETKAAVIDNNAHTVKAEVIAGTDVKTLKPELTISAGAMVSPTIGAVVDFTKPVIYTVTSEDLSTKVDWTISVSVAAASNGIKVPYSQDFETVTAEADIALSNWTNVAETGSRKWIGKSFSGNKYTQATSYGSKEVNVQWLISPTFDLSKSENEKFSFDVAIGYYTHEGLSIWISENYSDDYKTATWTNITSSFAIPKTPTSGYSKLAAAGTYDLSAYKGNVTLAFKYTGDATASKTTTYQIDNVKVSGDIVTESNEAEILTFLIPGETKPSLIDQANQTISATVKFGTDVKMLKPELTISAGAMVSPTIGSVVDFTLPVVYSVTAEDKVTKKDWKVTVAVADSILSKAAFITAFSIPEQISAAIIDTTASTIELSVYKGVDLTSLVPEILVSEGAKINPASKTPQDFSKPFVYTVTAEDTTVTRKWTVSVNDETPVLSELLPFEENFETIAADAAVQLDGWKNIAVVGAAKWIGKLYSGNKYPQASSFGTKEANEMWLVSPLVCLDSTAHETFTFDVNVGYWTHNGLSVFISENFDGINVSKADWMDITKLFAIPEGPASGYAKFASAGKIDLSSYKGNISIAFRYIGDANAGKTTTYQIDNVAVIAEELKTYTVTFNVMNKTAQKIEGVQVVFAGKTISTDAYGKAIFSGILPVENAPYKVLASEKYKGAEGVVTVTEANKVVNVLLDALGINDEDQELKIYPNPFKSVLYINSLPEGYNCIRVVNSQGICVYRVDLSGRGFHEVNLDYLANGMYFICLEGEGPAKVQRVMKQ